LASIDRTAYPRFKRVVSARELAEAFTPTTDEVEWARAKTTTERHFLALVVLLKCYQRLGYFPKLADVPAVVVDYVRGKLELDEVVEAVQSAIPPGGSHKRPSTRDPSTPPPRRPFPQSECRQVVWPRLWSPVLAPAVGMWVFVAGGAGSVRCCEFGSG